MPARLSAQAQGASKSAGIQVFGNHNGDSPHLNNVELGRYGRNRTNVWDYPGASSFHAGRQEELRMHPTVKPVALIADAIRDCSKRRGMVLDCFAGSGTTIIAAGKTGRRGYAMELDPMYVDVAVRRWQAYTGCAAVHAESGKTFDELAEVRKSQTEKSGSRPPQPRRRKRKTSNAR